jgi:aryl-alcohol dehydrogenase-like predicted oxidoreductase
VSERVRKLGLGTVQWGMDYGLTNREGMTPRAEVGRILAAARADGVCVLDTAALYGEAESVLGQHSLGGFRIVTKTPRFARAKITPVEVDDLRATFERSLVQLRVASLHGLLAHHADDLLVPGGERLIDAMRDLQREGKVSRIGVSVYEGAQISSLLERFTPDIVQLPINVLDQRLIEDGSLERLKALGIEVHARSAFLQGLLLMAPASLPHGLTPLRPSIEAWHAACNDQALSPLQAALSFVCDIDAIDCCLVGVQSLAQWSGCRLALASTSNFDASGLASNNPAFVNPANWRLQ